ncbi:TPA: hypothetical protein ACGTZ2_001358 [Salmonella enterica]
MNMSNGQLTPKSGLNAHIHKQNHLGDQLDDLGNISTDPNVTILVFEILRTIQLLGDGLMGVVGR